jgi:hypothetical protein
MKVWKQFDTDCSGFIEADELKQFIKALLHKRQGTNLTEEKLIEYTDTIVRQDFHLKFSIFFRLFSCISSIRMGMENYNSVK